MTKSDWISIGGLVLGIFGVAFAVWQYKKYTNLQKIVNDKVRGIYFDSKKLIEYCHNKDNFEQIKEKSRAIKYEIIRLDIANRNLDKEKIEGLKNNRKLTPEEAKEYKNLSSE